MNFTFTEDQLLFDRNISDFLNAEITPDRLRKSWDTDTGRDTTLWQQLVDMGLTAMLTPEDHGGLGLSVIDFVLIAQSCGRVALAEPLVDNTLVAAPLLTELASHNERCTAVLNQLTTGDAVVAVGHTASDLISDAHIADWLLLPRNDEIHLLEHNKVTLTPQESVDPSRKLFTVDWQPSSASCLCKGPQALDLLASSLNRGALGAAAQMLGLAEKMVEITVQYTSDREQFGRPLASNQAVKHAMADCAVKIEFAKAPLYRAAHTLSTNGIRADIDVSQAKIACSTAALLATKNCIQAHGAMGYTWECDLHIFMKRAWALDTAYGHNGFHKNRVHQWLLDPKTELGTDRVFCALLSNCKKQRTNNKNTAALSVRRD